MALARRALFVRKVSCRNNPWPIRQRRFEVNQLDWANQYLLPALNRHGVLSEENIKQREALLKKDNPNIDERTLRRARGIWPGLFGYR